MGWGGRWLVGKRLMCNAGRGGPGEAQAWCSPGLACLPAPCDAARHTPRPTTAWGGRQRGICGSHARCGELSAAAVRAMGCLAAIPE